MSNDSLIPSLISNLHQLFSYIYNTSDHTIKMYNFATTFVLNNFTNYCVTCIVYTTHIIVADVLMYIVVMEEDGPGGEADKLENQSKGD